MITCKPLAAFLRGAGEGIRQPPRIEIGRLSRGVTRLGMACGQRGFGGFGLTRRQCRADRAPVGLYASFGEGLQIGEGDALRRGTKLLDGISVKGLTRCDKATDLPLTKVALFGNTLTKRHNVVFF